MIQICSIAFIRHHNYYVSVIGVDSIRENGMTIPKYNNVKKPDSLFDEITSVKLPVDFFRTKANGREYRLSVSRSASQGITPQA